MVQLQLISDADPAAAELDAFIRSHPRGHYLQSPAWARVKPRWRWHGVLLRGEDGRIAGSLSLLERRVFPGCALLYAPRGPVCETGDAQALALLVDGARRLAHARGCCAILLEPDISETDSAFAENMRGLGLRLRRTEDFSGIQPRFVFRLPIAGKSEDAVFAGFSQKTRYQIRLAKRKGVQISCWSGDKTVPEEVLAQFAALMEETGRRDRFLTRGQEYFRLLLQSLGRSARLYLASYQGEFLAGAIAVQYGDKTWYLYGASSSRHREVMPNYLLQWEMIRWAITGGCRMYDFRGVSGNLDPASPLYGLYRFKKGFRGDFTAFCGQYICVCRPAACRLLQLALWANRRWRSLLRRIKAHSAKSGRLPPCSGTAAR